jgi:hypothetical protein
MARRCRVMPMFSRLPAGAIAAVALLKSGIHLVASLSVTAFLYAFHKAQS